MQDTLVLHVLPPFRGTGKRKLAATDKVYFFDIGVANALAGRRTLQPGSPEYGLALEQLVFLELRAAVDYRRLDTRITYWRTRTGLEVDFLLDDHTAVEVKATRNASSRDLRSLRALAQEIGPRSRLLVCREPHARRTDDGIEILPVRTFCERVWSGELAG